MGKSFKWVRHTVTREDYDRCFEDQASNPDGNTGKTSKLHLAYNQASEIRKFEIELFWKRATFFWAFIVAIYTAYYHVLTVIYKSESTTCVTYQHGKLPLVLLAGLGLFFCVSWLLSSYGSKHWQENWENHLMLLEDNVTGPLHKTYEHGKAFSESKIVIAAGWVVSVCSYGLFVYEVAQLLQCKLEQTKGIDPFVITLVIAILVFVMLFAYAQIVRGTTDNTGEIKFQIQEFEEDDE